MAEQTFTFQEIQKRIANLEKITSDAFVGLIHETYANNPNSNDNPYKKMDFSTLLYFSKSFSHLAEGVSSATPQLNLLAEYGTLVKDFEKIDKVSLSTEQWKSLDALKKQLLSIKTFFDRANKEADVVKTYMDSKLTEIIKSGAPLTKLPREIDSNLKFEILFKVKKEVSKASKEDLSKYAVLLLLMYKRIPNSEQEKYLNELKALETDGIHTKLSGAIQTELKTIFTQYSKFFSEEDKKILTETLGKKSFFAKLFRRAAARAEQKAIEKQILSNTGKDMRR